VVAAERNDETTGEGDLFRAGLNQSINMIGGKIDWDGIDREIAPLYSGNAGLASQAGS
jgi:hypothetical protein